MGAGLVFNLWEPEIKIGNASIRMSDRRTPLPNTIMLQWKFFARDDRSDLMLQWGKKNTPTSVTDVVVDFLHDFFLLWYSYDDVQVRI